MPTKRSFAHFQDSYQRRLEEASLSPVAYTTPPTHDNPSPKYIQDLATLSYECRASIPKFPLLCRRTSLPTLPQLRTLAPWALLTFENLHSMDPTLKPQMPMTPVSEKSRSSTTTNNSADNGRRMCLVNLLDCEEGKDRLKQRKEFKDAVALIVGGPRGSAMKPASVQRFGKARAQLKRRNEAPIQARLMPFLVKDERTISRAEVDEEVLQSFEMDHLDWSIDREFAKDSVPLPRFLSGSPAKYGTTNPKPDITYGIKDSAFNTLQLRAFLDFEPQVSPGIHGPFLTIQWKGCNGSLESAKDQARRDGAAMVNSRRKAMVRISLDSLSQDELDEASIAFTCAINPESAHISVHWSEEVEDRTEWLMATVGRYHMEDDDDIPNLRSALHNILDWGLTKRLGLIKSQVDLYQEQVAPSYDNSGNSAKRRRI